MPETHEVQILKKKHRKIWNIKISDRCISITLSNLQIETNIIDPEEIIEKEEENENKVQPCDILSSPEVV